MGLDRTSVATVRFGSALGVVGAWLSEVLISRGVDRDRRSPRVGGER